MNRFVAGLLVVALAACEGLPGTPGGSNSGIERVLTQLGNTLIADLQQQKAVALAATPPDIDGAQCAGALPDPAKSGDTGSGALAVAAAIQKVAAVTAGKNVGALTVAEIATLYAPGSEQFQWAEKTLVSACSAKVLDVQHGINSTAGIVMGIPAILALGAPLGV